MKKPLQDYSGVIHVHTRHSDGSGTTHEVISAAQEAELDFLIITDHNTMKPKEDGAEQWHWRNAKFGNSEYGMEIKNSKSEIRNSVLVLVGEEVTKREGHCLALNVEADGLYRKEAHQYIPDVHKQNGLTFLCHPHFGAKLQFGIPDTSWKRWDIFNGKYSNREEIWPTGIELWSHLGDWAEDLNWFSFISHVKNPNRYIEGPDKKTIQVWDELTQIRPLVAFGGVDAHAKTVLPFNKGVTITYYESFQALRTHILIDSFTGQWSEDSCKVYDALRKGHCYVSCHLWGNAKGFQFNLNNNKNEPIAIMGDTIPFIEKSILDIQSPHDQSQIRLLRNGSLIQEFSQPSLQYPLSDKGVYRVEIYLDNKPWIFSNPIYIR